MDTKKSIKKFLVVCIFIISIVTITGCKADIKEQAVKAREEEINNTFALVRVGIKSMNELAKVQALFEDVDLSDLQTSIMFELWVAKFNVVEAVWCGADEETTPAEAIEYLDKNSCTGGYANKVKQIPMLITAAEDLSSVSSELIPMFSSTERDVFRELMVKPVDQLIILWSEIENVSDETEGEDVNQNTLLNEEEQEYFRVMNDVVNRRNIGFYSGSLLIEKLKTVSAPESFESQHADLILKTNTYVNDNQRFSNAAVVYMTSMLQTCDISSYNYYTCKNDKEKYKTAYETSLSDVKVSQVEFLSTWNAAIEERNQYMLDHGANPNPTATPFSVPPQNGFSPLKDMIDSQFGAAVQVNSIDLDATEYVHDQNRYSKEPEVGEKYILIDVTVRNNSDEKIWASSSQFLIMIGEKEYTNGSPSIENAYKSTELAPGESISGVIAFIISESSAEDVLIYYLDGEIIWQAK